MFGPKSIDNDSGLLIDRFDEFLAGIVEFFQGVMTVTPSHFFSHPIPQPFDGVQVRTVSRQKDQLDSQFGSLLLHFFRPLTRSIVPNDHQATCFSRSPFLDPSEKLTGILSITTAFMPDQTFAMTIVIGSVPIDPG